MRDSELKQFKFCFLGVLFYFCSCDAEIQVIWMKIFGIGVLKVMLQMIDYLNGGFFSLMCDRMRVTSIIFSKRWIFYFIFYGDTRSRYPERWNLLACYIHDRRKFIENVNLGGIIHGSVVCMCVLGAVEGWLWNIGI